jgi:predicted CxxxxCH...CXXCH cytochrome family protein
MIGAGWTVDEFEGHVLIPNTSKPEYSYNIESNTADTITVGCDNVPDPIYCQGLIDLTQVTAGVDTFSVVYGQLFRYWIVLDDIIGLDTPKSGVKVTRLFDNTGPNSFADGDATYDGVCEVCHTDTTYHRNDATGDHTHNVGTDCSGCHGHLKGFAADCTLCHGEPPVDPGTLVFDPGPTGSATAGKHGFHVNTRNYGCDTCHAGNVENGEHNNSLIITMGFSMFGGARQGGDYAGQPGVIYNTTATTPPTTAVSGSGGAGDRTCSNIFCHGRLADRTNWGGGVNTSPVWDGTVICGDCHGATAQSPPSEGSHSKHCREFLQGYNYDCSLCHTVPAVDDSLHGNNKSEIVFSSDPKTNGGSYDGTDLALDAYGTCNSIYCHSTVQSSPPGTGPTYRLPPVWGGNIVGCGACHYFSDSGLNTGSHEKHFYSEPTDQCYACHNWNNSDDPCLSCHDDASARSQKDRHANYIIDVAFAPKYGGNYSGSSTPGVGYGDCSNTYCHSDGTSVSTGIIPNNTTVIWGTVGPLDCNVCHGNPPGYANGSPKANSHTLVDHAAAGCNICHNTTTNDGVTISSIAAHGNQSYDVDAGGGESFTYTFDAAGGTCDTVSCHTGNATRQWGSQP